MRRRSSVVGGDAAEDARQRVAPRVAEALMPDIGGDGGVGVKVAVRRGHADGVQIVGGITSEDHPLGSPVLNDNFYGTQVLHKLERKYQLNPTVNSRG